MDTPIQRQSADRSVAVGGSVTGSGIVTGDHSKVIQQSGQPPDDSATRAELQALRRLLEKLQTAEQGKIGRALDDAEEEAAKPAPNRDEVGRALERALGYAKQAEGIASVLGELKPRLLTVARWLGAGWQHLAGLF